MILKPVILACFSLSSLFCRKQFNLVQENCQRIEGLFVWDTKKRHLGIVCSRDLSFTFWTEMSALIGRSLTVFRLNLLQSHFELSVRPFQIANIQLINDLVGENYEEKNKMCVCSRLQFNHFRAITRS